MASWYVWSGATGGGTGVDWVNAYITLQAAMTAKAAGDTFFVANDHVQTQATALTITSPGTDANPCRVYCVNRSGSVPPVSADLMTTATISTTVGSALTINGTVIEYYGITFTCGSSTNSAAMNIQGTAGRAIRMVNCALRLGSTNVANRITIGAAGSYIVLENTTLQFAAVGQAFAPTGRVVWRNTPNAIAGATIPTVLLITGASASNCLIEAVDLSAAASGKTLVNIANTAATTIMIKDCKLGAGVGIVTGTYAGNGGVEVTLLRCDSGDTNYRTERHSYSGKQTTELTIIRTGGATDGTTAVSWKIETTANVKWEYPFEAMPISIWNETVGSPVTVTIEGIWGGGATPLNDEIWIDVEYLANAGFPLGDKETCTKMDGLTAGTNLPAGSGTWGGSTTKFALSVTFTPEEKGPFTIYVRAAKINSTFWIDPKPVIT